METKKTHATYWKII